MQSHSGEHIVSGVVHSLFGYDNVGFHMSEKTMTVDFSGPLTAEDIARVELESNKAIYKNAPITASYPTKEELIAMEEAAATSTTEATTVPETEAATTKKPKKTKATTKTTIPPEDEE